VLNANFASASSEIVLAKAQEILETGDFKTILRDATSGRALALRCLDERARPCFALAFSPGGESSALQPAVAALLLRMVREATHAGEPYAIVRASEVEALTGQPLPLNGGGQGASVLDEAASQLTTGEGSGDLASLLSAQTNPPSATQQPRTLSAWVAALALFVALVNLAAVTFRATRS
jgi:hypothetical protein